MEARLGKAGLFFSHLASISRLFVVTLYWAFVAPWRERRAGFDRRSVLRFMDETGVQSVPIVVLIGVLVGVILVLQTANCNAMVRCIWWRGWWQCPWPVN